MRLRNIPGSRENIAASDFCLPEEMQPSHKGRWREVFENTNPIHLEIGMGKGRFLMELAERNQEINYIGMEKYSSVLLRALQKIEECPKPNVRLLRMDAEYITEIFEQGEVEHIYLNFSDPWPKDRHEKRRLTSKEYLARYEQVLKKGGEVEFKTDNKDLFEFSIEQTREAGWHVDAVSYDLHQDQVMSRENIMTEYEERFSSMGHPIYKLVIGH